MPTWLLLGAAVLCEVTASLSLKGALEHPELYTVVVVGYLASFVLLAAVLRQGFALGVAYGIWSASGVALTTGLSTLLFHERFTGVMGVGILLIVVGVLLVETGSRHGASEDVAA